ncbi:MAG: transposase family protein [Solirubrobacterales bacterium]|nr:transposase family protein [Solirubrobacterales bacterium]
MASPKVAGGAASAALKTVLDSPEIGRLIEELEATRWTGRPGYPVRTMVGLALAKSLYALPTWTKVVALVADHWKLQRVLGCEGTPPSQWAAYRFAAKLRENAPAVERCIDSVVSGLKDKLPSYGTDLAIDASDMPAYPNGQRYLSNGGPEREHFSDPDATWGHRSAVSTRKGGGFYGYRLHAAVCVATDLPVAWTVETARDHETLSVAPLIETARRRGAMVATAALDKGYDNNRVYAECAERDCLPLIPLRRTTSVKNGAHLPPTCSHGTWTFAGSDRKRGAAKWRCPTGECAPASIWRKASRLHPLIPRETKRWKAAYRKRAAVEREFGRLKIQWGLKPLRVRGLDRVRLHADLTILTKLACALSRARAATAPSRRQRGSSRASVRPAPMRVRPATRRE